MQIAKGLTNIKRFVANSRFLAQWSLPNNMSEKLNKLLKNRNYFQIHKNLISLLELYCRIRKSLSTKDFLHNVHEPYKNQNYKNII